MFAGLPSLSHEQQQKAVERIQELMSQGMSSGQAIALVADELRASHTGDRIVARFEMKTSKSPVAIRCRFPGAEGSHQVFSRDRRTASRALRDRRARR